MVFTDPQLGKYDLKQGNDGLDWRLDLKHIEQMCSNINKMNQKPEFIICMGDMG